MDVTPVAVPTCAIDDPEYAEDVHISREIDDFTEQPAPDFISEDSLQSQQDTTNSSVSESEESSDEEVEYVRGPLGNKFMDTKQILELLKSPHALLSDIPTGRKDGMECTSSWIIRIISNEDSIMITQNSGMTVELGRAPVLQQLCLPKLEVN